MSKVPEAWTPGGRRALVWLLMAVLVAAGVFLLVPRGDTGQDCGAWEEGTRCGAWNLAYDGFGSAGGVEDAEGWRFRLEPRAVQSPEETSAALALSIEQFGDLEVSARMRTDEQLRRPEGNPWEVAWLLWHHTDDQHFYYVALKPNGWELGKAHPDHPGAQRFLATGPDPGFPIGRSYEVQVRQIGNRIQVTVDGDPLVDFRDEDEPYLHGSVGLYTEDAAVEFSSIRIEALEDPDPVER